MYKGVTPTYTLTFDDETLDFGEASEVLVTITDKNRIVLLEIGGSDLTLDENTISFNLSQEQTLAMPIGGCKVQVNWLYDSAGETKRACSNIVDVNFFHNLHNEVM